MVVAVLMGSQVVLLLGSHLWREVHALRKEYATARDRKPIGYLGIANEMPGFRPLSGVVRREGGRVLLWAGNRHNQGPDEWWDVTGLDIPLHEFVAALGRDRVRAIDYPIYNRPDGAIAKNIYPEREVFGLAMENQYRAYPRTVMAKCEVVNDTVGQRTIAVTYCPLIDEVQIYERTLDGQEISLGTSGYVYKGAFVLYDRATDSLWIPRDTGLTAITGRMAGKVLARLAPPERMEWGKWQRHHPDTLVLVGADRTREVTRAE
jgi:hypothetical protein